MHPGSRRTVVAACLFVGGLVVGSQRSAPAIPGPCVVSSDPNADVGDPKGGAPKTDGKRALGRGQESPALRALREAAKSSGAADRDEIEPPDWALDETSAPSRRSSLRGRRARSDEAARGDDPLAGLKLPERLPVRRHPRVTRYVRYFSESPEGRKFFAAALRRSGRVEEIVGKNLREAHLPQELSAVAFVESGFTPTAVSSAGAAGLWQFMPQTARAYGLTVERDLDERASLWRSTEAASKHLADLYERFHSWDLALAAYNLGYEGLTRRMDELETDDYWALVDVPGALPNETAHYVPKVLAVAVILRNLEELGFADVERAAPVDASELEVPGGTRVSLVARASGTSLRALRDLNPELRSDIVPERGAPVVLHVPKSGLARARVMLPRLLGEPEDHDKGVSADFDWGRDDLAAGKSRLERTRRGATFEPDEEGIEAPVGGPAPTRRHVRLDYGHAPARGETTRSESPRAETSRSGRVDPQDRLGHVARERLEPVERSPRDPLDPLERALTAARDERGERVPRDPASGARRTDARPRPTHDGRAPAAPAPEAEPTSDLRAATSRPASPAAVEERPPSSNVVYYRVSPSDTAASVAATFGLSVGELLAQVGLDAPDRLKAGSLLEITAAPRALHQLKEGGARRAAPPK